MKTLLETLNTELYTVLLEELQSVWKKTRETVTIQDKIKNFCT